jgi:hypothetical protein
MKACHTRYYLLVLIALQCCVNESRAQSALAHAVTERVLLWLRIQDGDMAPDDCAYTREELQGGVFGMDIRPLSLPGIDRVPLHHVTVNPRLRLLPGESHAFPRNCIHADAPPQTWVVATLADSTFRFVSGPGLLDSHGAVSTDRLSDLDLARLRLAYLDPTALRLRHARPDAFEVRAFSQSMGQKVAIRFRGNGRETFEISALQGWGRQRRVLKPFRYGERDGR